MPSSDGLRNALTKMGAAPDGPRRIIWTSLREEPVLYVRGRPHVLRLVDRPLTNVETTGVTATVVERMEVTLKEDVLREIRKSGGRMLLHDEVETKPGVYEVVPIWEEVREDEVMTPRELYKRVEDEHFHVDYMRIAIVRVFLDAFPAPIGRPVRDAETPPSCTTRSIQLTRRRTSRRRCPRRCSRSCSALRTGSRAGTTLCSTARWAAGGRRRA